MTAVRERKKAKQASMTPNGNVKQASVDPQTQNVSDLPNANGTSKKRNASEEPNEASKKVKIEAA